MRPDRRRDPRRAGPSGVLKCLPQHLDVSLDRNPYIVYLLGATKRHFLALFPLQRRPRHVRLRRRHMDPSGRGPGIRGNLVVGAGLHLPPRHPSPPPAGRGRLPQAACQTCCAAYLHPLGSRKTDPLHECLRLGMYPKGAWRSVRVLPRRACKRFINRNRAVHAGCPEPPPASRPVNG